MCRNAVRKLSSATRVVMSVRRGPVPTADEVDYTTFVGVMVQKLNPDCELADSARSAGRGGSSGRRRTAPAGRVSTQDCAVRQGSRGACHGDSPPSRPWRRLWRVPRHSRAAPVSRRRTPAPLRRWSPSAGVAGLCVPTGLRGGQRRRKGSRRRVRSSLARRRSSQASAASTASTTAIGVVSSGRTP